MASSNNRWSKHSEDASIPDNAIEGLKVAQELSLPNVEAILKVCAVLPITSVEAERSFSKLKLIKDQLRSTMCNARYHYDVRLLKRPPIKH